MFSCDIVHAVSRRGEARARSLWARSTKENQANPDQASHHAALYLSLGEPGQGEAPTQETEQTPSGPTQVIRLNLIGRSRARTMDALPRFPGP
jgi:hypothetical protein